MSFKSIRQQQEEIYREEQILNFMILMLPWMYVAGMSILHFAMEYHGTRLHGDIHIFPGFVRTRYHSFFRGTSSDLGLLGFLFNPSFGFWIFLAYGLLMPIPHGDFVEKDWHTITDWKFSLSKLAALFAAVICGVLLFLFSDPSFCGNTVSRKYCLIFMGIALAASLLLYALIKWALQQKIIEQVNLSYNLQIALRAVEIGSIILIFGVCMIFVVLKHT